MVGHLNYFYHNNELCLEMNETFTQYVDTLNNIIKTINSNLEYTKICVTDYYTLQQINPKWIKSNYNVNDDFISWWDFCIVNKYTDYLKNVGKIGDLLCLKNITLDNNFNIKIQNGHNLDNFYITFLKFNVCQSCYFGVYNRCGCCNTIKMDKYIYFKNLINAHEEIDNRVTELYREVTQELFDSISRLQKKFDYFDNNHKQDVSHFRTDVESGTFMTDNERKVAKTHCEDVIAKLEQTVADQAQMIKELREELKKQRDDFEAYKLQKQRQLAALM